MWLVRLRMRYARPCARGRNRLSVGPSSTYAREITSVSGSSEKLFSALAIALASPFATGSLAACGANSPSLCPTMPSGTNTGTCLRPSCTAIVCSSMSGMIVERRDQVLMTFLLPLSFCTSTFLSRWSSTNGPFFKLRGIVFSSGPLVVLLLRAATANDHAIALLHPPGASLGLAVRVHRVATAGRLALTTTVRVVDRVHGNTAHARALALPAHAAGLAPVDVRLLGVADLADGRAAAHVDIADLAGRHAQLREGAVLRDE